MGRVLTNATSLAYAVEESLGVANGIQATGTLTLSGNAGDTETVVIDGKTYTFQASLTESDGNVLVGATAADSISNLAAAINLDAGAGTLYAAATTLHPTVSAEANPTTLVVMAKTGGTPGNAITTTETMANGSWGGATLSGGVDPVWHELEPNGLTRFGSEITTVARAPISKNRQRQKGTTTDLDSGVEWEGDLTLHHFENFIRSFVFAEFIGARTYDPASADADSYTVTANGTALAAGTLVYGRGWTNPANNGLKEVDSGATTTDIPVVETLAVETAPAKATVEIAGFRGATGDLEIDSNGDLISTVLDFTTLEIEIGQVVHIGGLASANRFTAAANFGFARVTEIAANKLTLDKRATTFVTDTGAGKQVDLLFGRFLRNVPVDHADYLEQSLQFEAGFPNLEAGGATGYEYAKGNYANQVEVQLPGQDKALMTFGFVGTDTAPPSTTRANGAASSIPPAARGAFNTSSDILRLRITEVDETGLTTDFKSATLTLNNNVTGEKVLAFLGSKYLNVGIFEVSLEAQLLFTSSAVVEAIRENRTVTLDFALRNDDGAIFFDIPSVTLGGGGREYPVNESVLINVTSQAFEDATLGTSLGISLFPFVPAS